MKLLAPLSLLTLLLLPSFTAPVHAEELIVSAAASLTDAFKDIEADFESRHPSIDVILNFASSGALFRQMEQGAPVDVYASANPKWMKKSVDLGLVSADSVTTFAQNALVLATPADHSVRIMTIADLTGSGVKLIGIGTPETVPAGQYAKGALEAADLYERLHPKYIFGESVRQVLDYLVRGEVDCGFVYQTDAVKAGKAVKIVTELPLKTPVSYPIAPLLQAEHPEAAQTFVDFVLSPGGKALLKTRGFKTE